MGNSDFKIGDQVEWNFEGEARSGVIVEGLSTPGWWYVSSNEDRDHEGLRRSIHVRGLRHAVKESSQYAEEYRAAYTNHRGQTMTWDEANGATVEERGFVLDKKDANFEQCVRATYDAAELLLLQKHKDYGPKNISQSPGGPLNGLRVRMWDKMARINNLLDTGAQPENESLRDSFVDLLNYSAIALLVLDGDWPDE